MKLVVVFKAIGSFETDIMNKLVKYEYCFRNLELINYDYYRTLKKKEVGEEDIDWASKLKKVTVEEGEAGEVVDEGVVLKQVTQEITPLELGERREVELVSYNHG